MTRRPGIPAKGDILDLLGDQVKSVPVQRRPSPVRLLCDGGGGGRLQRTPEPTLLCCNYLLNKALPLEAPLFATLNQAPICTTLCPSSASPLTAGASLRSGRSPSCSTPEGGFHFNSPHPKCSGQTADAQGVNETSRQLQLVSQHWNWRALDRSQTLLSRPETQLASHQTKREVLSLVVLHAPAVE